MQKISFMIAQIALIYNLLRDVDPLDSIVRALTVYFAVYLILLFHRFINRRHFGHTVERARGDVQAKQE